MEMAMPDMIYLWIPSGDTLAQINDHVNASEARYGALTTLTNGTVPDGSNGTLIGIDRDQENVSPGNTKVVQTVGDTAVAPDGFPNLVCRGTVYITGQLESVAAYRK
jgi:hypothetical protein